MSADNQMVGHGDMWSSCFTEGIVNTTPSNHLSFHCFWLIADLQIDANADTLMQMKLSITFRSDVFFPYLLPERKYE